MNENKNSFMKSYMKNTSEIIAETKERLSVSEPLAHEIIYEIMNDILHLCLNLKLKCFI